MFFALSAIVLNLVRYLQNRMFRSDYVSFELTLKNIHRCLCLKNRYQNGFFPPQNEPVLAAMLATFENRVKITNITLLTVFRIQKVLKLVWLYFQAAILIILNQIIILNKYI